ncbi:ClpXP protease specificity-enhancing factor SspB [Tistrella bauzanensis]
MVRTVLEEAAEHGLSDGHHFYLTFRTQAPGVEVPEYLRARYPDEMTIVIEHQYWGLDVNSHGFAVTLAFGGRHERLVVPFATITGFADPSVKFGLQFHAVDDADDVFDEDGEDVEDDLFELEDRLPGAQDNDAAASLPPPRAATPATTSWRWTGSASADRWLRLRSLCAFSSRPAHSDVRACLVSRLGLA